MITANIDFLFHIFLTTIYLGESQTGPSFSLLVIVSTIDFLFHIFLTTVYLGESQTGPSFSLLLLFLLLIFIALSFIIIFPLWLWRIDFFQSFKHVKMEIFAKVNYSRQADKVLLFFLSFFLLYLSIWTFKIILLLIL